MKPKAKSMASLLIALAMILSCVPSVTFAAEEVTYLLRDVNDGASTEVAMDVYKTYETAHFQIFYDTDGANSAKVTTAFLQKCETVLENCWTLFIDEMGMEPTSTSVNSGGDKTTQYKTNVVLMGTGVTYYDLGANDWGAYGSVDTAGYPYFMCCLAAMDSPTVVAHEFGHAVHYAQGDNAWKDNIYLGPWFEAVANWFAEQYTYKYLSGNGSTLSPHYLRSTPLTKMNGRAYYEAWPILQYLYEDPDNTGVYGNTFIQKILSYNSGSTSTLFWEVLENCNGDLTTADTVGMYASRMATMDFAKKEKYNAVINSASSYFFWQQRYAMLEELGETGQYAIAPERAPQAMGYNITPLDFTPGTVSVTLNGLTNSAGAAWRARLVKEASDSTTTYSDLFGAGETMTVEAASGDKLYLSVAATPELSTIVKHTIGGWAEHSKESVLPYENKTRYPYSVTLVNAVPMKPVAPSGVTFKTHSNGGGKVATTASVASTAYVGPNAIVMGSATVSGNAVIDGYAVVAESAKVSGNAYVGDTAVVLGSATVTDNARVIENACVYANYKVSGSAVVKGLSLGLGSGGASGEAITYGDWFEDGGYNISGGSYSGYHSISSDSAYSIVKPNSIYYRPNAYHLRSRYEFNGSPDDSLADTNLYGVNSPAFADGCVKFDGSSYAVLDSSALYYENAKLYLSAKGEGTALSIGDGAITLKIENGAVSLNDISVSGSSTDFNSIEIELNGTSAVLKVNGAEASGTVSKTLLDAARSGKHYIGKGFTGSVDYLRICDMSYAYDKEAGVMNGDFTEKLNTVGNTETGTLSSKTSDANSIWQGWSSTNTTAVTVDGGLNITGSVSATITSPAVKTDKFVIEFTPSGGKAYPDHAVLDANGKTVLFAHRYAADASAIHIGRGETNSAVRGTDSITDTAGQARLTSFIGERLCSGTMRADRGAIDYSDGKRVRIIVENTSWTDSMAETFSISENSTDNLSAMTAGDSVYTVTYAKVEDGLVTPISVSAYKGSITGFGGFKTAGGASGVAVSYKDLVIYADASNETKVVITYTIGGVPVTALERSYNPESEMGAAFGEVYEYENGGNYIYYAGGNSYSESQKVEMTKLPNVGLSAGTYVENEGTAYKTLSENLIPNGDFTYGLKGWYNSAGGEAASDCFKVNGDGTVTALKHTGAAGEGSLYRAWDIEIGKTYMFSYTSNVANSYHKTSQKDDISATGDGTIIGEGKNCIVFTAAKEYLQINFRWLKPDDGTAANTLGSFALYEVENAEADRTVTTVKFTAGGAEIAADLQISGFKGDVIDLADTTVVPDKITTSGGKIYIKDASNPSSHTVAATGETVTITYTESTLEGNIASVEAVSATVIGSNLPVLPKALTATLTDGSTCEVNITDWDFSSLTAGENTVYGKIEGTTLSAEASITVLPERFALADSDSKGKDDNIIKFPQDISGEFYIEFDLVINTVGDSGVNFGYNGSKWSSGAFGISPNGGALKATGGNKTGTSDGGTVLKSSVSAGDTYRILVKANASTDTFSVYATGSDGSVGKAENKTFRKEQSPDCLNSINLRGNNRPDNDISIKNVKAYYADYATISYIFNGATLYSEQADKGLPASSSYYYKATADGTASVTGNYLYGGAYTGTPADNITVNVALVPNDDVSGMAKGNLYVGGDNVPYSIVSGNLIPNGSFNYGFAGYYTGTKADSLIGSDGFTLTQSADGNYITSTESKPVGGIGSILTGFDIEPSKKYVFTVDIKYGYVDGGGASAKNFIQLDVLDAAAFPKAAALSKSLKVYSDDWTTAAYVVDSGSAQYLELCFRWINNVSFRNFGLYEIETPLLTPTLGWDGESFTIDFLFGSGFTFASGADYGVEITAQGSDAPITQAFNSASEKGVGLNTAYTNRLYKAAPYAILNGVTHFGGSTEGESVYSLVMRAVSERKFTGKIDAVQLAKVNEVLKNGGFYVDESGEITDEAKLVMTKLGNVITLNDNAIDAGLVFSDGSGNHYTSVTLNSDGTVTLGGAAQDVIVFSLETVELEFVEETIDEVDFYDDCSIDFDFTEIM